jgi:hypothetical protein
MAAAISLAIGMFFVFVRAPHPWGWEGIDEYRDLGLSLARGEGFATLQRMWGYPLFLAAFYAIFGDRQWIPLVVQVVLNATLPILIFFDARRTFGPHTAAVAALLTGALSFNTVYASTQTADSLSTVLFVATVVCFRTASDRPSLRLFAASGVLAGLAALFRPNLILFPVALVLYDAVARRRRGWRVSHAVTLLLPAVLVWIPWPIRNYELTGRFIPATTRGSVQLWYGSLQSGEYFERRYDNPRSRFETSPFSYSMPGPRELVVTARPVVEGQAPLSADLVYWTDRDTTPRRVATDAQPDGQRLARIPAQPPETVVYYYVDALWPGGNGAPERQSTPLAGAQDPQWHVISDRHFEDIDLRHDLLDVFDVAMLLRASVWHESVSDSRLDIDRDGTLGAADIDRAVSLLAASVHDARDVPTGALSGIDHDDTHATLTFSDRSALIVPRDVSRLVDFDVHGIEQSIAANVLRSARSFRAPPLDAAAQLPHDRGRPFQLLVQIDRVFWRAEPLWMDRYSALAMDNIRRAPGAFIVASARRLFRMFVVFGSEDTSRSVQFESSRVVYRAAAAASTLLLLLFAAGVIVAWRERVPIGVYLLAILYIPATIFTLLPNMRYVIPAQPLMFVLVARALLALGRSRP